MSLVRSAAVTVALLLAFLTPGLAQTRAPPPPRRPTREEQTQFAECLLQGGTREECRAVLGEAAGAEGERDEVRERLEAEHGLPAAVAEQMKNCTGDKKKNLTMADPDRNLTKEEKKDISKECRMEAMQALMRLKGDDFRPEDVEQELFKAAAEAAREILKACLDAAVEREAKDECFNNEEALQQLAAITGQDISEFSADDLREALREGAARDVMDEIAECRRQAEDDDAAKECFNLSDAVKEEIANSRGKDSDEVRDSDVREFLEEGARADMWSIMKNCKENREECIESAKETLGAAIGEADISVEELEKRLKEAMRSDLAEAMAACMKSAEDEDARKLCRETVAEAALGIAENRSHTKGERNMALKEAGNSAARDVVKDCKEDRETCMAHLREKVAESTGRLPSELSDMELERFNKEGSKEAAREALKSCAAAKEADPTATCSDALSVYEEGRGKGTMDEAEKRRVKQELAEDLEKEDIKQCLKSDDKDAFKACMENLVDSDVTDELFTGLEEKVKDAKQKRAKAEAAVNAVGSMFGACMEVAETEDDKKECKKEIKKNADKAGMTEDVDDLVKKHHRNVVAEAARSCAAETRGECVKEAKEELMKMGMKRREFGVVKRLANLKEAAETWAECQEASSTADDASCATLAQTTLEELSGSTDIWDDELAQKVQDLAEALMEGSEVFIRKLKQVLVEAVSNESDCSDAFLDKIIDKVMDISNNFTVPGDRNITGKKCRVVFNKARYFCRVATEDLDENETMQISDSIADELTTADLSGRRLSLRRLAETIDETYADQEMEETSGDSSTSSTLPDDGSTTSSGGSISANAAVVPSLPVGLVSASLALLMI